MPSKIRVFALLVLANVLCFNAADSRAQQDPSAHDPLTAKPCDRSLGGGDESRLVGNLSEASTETVDLNAWHELADDLFTLEYAAAEHRAAEKYYRIRGDENQAQEQAHLGLEIQQRAEAFKTSVAVAATRALNSIAKLPPGSVFRAKIFVQGKAIFGYVRVEKTEQTTGTRDGYLEVEFYKDANTSLSETGSEIMLIGAGEKHTLRFDQVGWLSIPKVKISFPENGPPTDAQAKHAARADVLNERIENWNHSVRLFEEAKLEYLRAQRDVTWYELKIYVETKPETLTDQSVQRDEAQIAEYRAQRDEAQQRIAELKSRLAVTSTIADEAKIQLHYALADQASTLARKAIYQVKWRAGRGAVSLMPQYIQIRDRGDLRNGQHLLWIRAASQVLALNQVHGLGVRIEQVNPLDLTIVAKVGDLGFMQNKTGADVGVGHEALAERRNHEYLFETWSYIHWDLVEAESEVTAKRNVANAFRREAARARDRKSAIGRAERLDAEVADRIKALDALKQNIESIRVQTLNSIVEQGGSNVVYRGAVTINGKSILGFLRIRSGTKAIREKSGRLSIEFFPDTRVLPAYDGASESIGAGEIYEIGYNDVAWLRAAEFDIGKDAVDRLFQR